MSIRLQLPMIHILLCANFILQLQKLICTKHLAFWEGLRGEEMNSCQNKLEHVNVYIVKNLII